MSSTLRKSIRRRPQVVIIDGLAYDNPPGSKHEKRWQDIEELLESGISVLASVNTQYVAELQDEVESITGTRPPESVPRSFLEKADDIVIVDAPAHESFDANRARGARRWRAYPRSTNFPGFGRSPCCWLPT